MKDGVILGPRGSGIVGEGGGEWSGEMPHCSDLLCRSDFPFRRVGCIKEAQRGDLSKARTRRADSPPLWGYCSLTLGLSYALTFFISNIWAQEEMMCGRHGRKSLTARLKQQQ